jgi:hypothetical protein
LMIGSCQMITFASPSSSGPAVDRNIPGGASETSNMRHYLSSWGTAFPKQPFLT